MKKIILLSSAFMLLASASANADVSVGVNFGEPEYAEPIYLAPAPVYVEPGPSYVVAPDWPSEHYDRHRYRHNNYWAHREHDEHRHEGRYAEHD